MNFDRIAIRGNLPAPDGCIPFAAWNSGPAPPAAQIDPPERPDRRQVVVNKLLGPRAILQNRPSVVGETIELGLLALHREDPRYFRVPEGRFGQRFRHALVSTVIVRGADGSNAIGTARLADVFRECWS